MALAFLLAGSTSGGLPILLTAGLALAFGGTSIGAYGLDYFARPIELHVFQRALGRPTVAPTPA